jgi:hypothetical protein
MRRAGAVLQPDRSDDLVGIARLDTFMAICDECGREETYSVRNNPSLGSAMYGRLPVGWDYVTRPPHYPAAYSGPRDWEGSTVLLCPACITKRKGVSV